MRKKNWMLILGVSAAFLAYGSAAVAEEDAGESKAAMALKHRHGAPKVSDIDGAASLDALLAKTGKDDWSASKAATVEGYVITVEHEEDGDTHIALAAAAKEPDSRKWLIAEVTPQMRAGHKAFSDKSLRKLHGQKVSVTGWLYFEPDTDSQDPRGTLWELHPVSSIAPAK